MARGEESDLARDVIERGRWLFGLTVRELDGLIVASTSHPVLLAPEKLADVLARAVNTCLDLAARHDGQHGTDVLPRLKKLLHEQRDIEHLGGVTVPGVVGAPDALADSSRIGAGLLSDLLLEALLEEAAEQSKKRRRRRKAKKPKEEGSE